MDIVMPGMDGYQACRKLAVDPATRAIPVVFVLGQRDMMTAPRQARELIERCRAAAVRGGLPAPSVVEIADCGHQIMSERPDALLGALRDFLAAPVVTPG